MADYVSVDTQGWFVVDVDNSSSASSSISGTYLQYTDIPNQYITKCATSNYAGSVGGYNNERELFDILVTESINKHGICMDYYITSYDIRYDRIWGEDNNRRYERRFQIMASYTMPREEKLFSKFGLENMDSFSMFISKRHFWEASQFNDIQTIPKSFDPYIPKIGDYIFAKYNKFVYEVVEVKDEIMMNLQSKQHSWELIVKPFTDMKITTTPLTSASPLAIYTNKKTDIFDISSTVDEKIVPIEYKPPIAEKVSQDPFANW